MKRGHILLPLLLLITLAQLSLAQAPTEEEMGSRLDEAITSGDYSSISPDDWVFIGAVPSLVARIPATSYVSLPAEAWGSIDQALIPPENIRFIPPANVDPRRIPRDELDRLITAQIAASIDEVPNIALLDRRALNTYLAQTYIVSITLQARSCQPSCTLVGGVLMNGRGDTATLSSYPESRIATMNDGSIRITLRPDSTIQQIPSTDRATLVAQPRLDRAGHILGVTLPNGLILTEGTIQHNQGRFFVPPGGASATFQYQADGSRITVVTAGERRPEDAGVRIYVGEGTRDYPSAQGIPPPNYVFLSQGFLIAHGDRFDVRLPPQSGFISDEIDYPSVFEQTRLGFTLEDGEIRLGRDNRGNPESLPQVFVTGNARIHDGRFDLRFSGSQLRSNIFSHEGPTPLPLQIFWQDQHQTIPRPWEDLRYGPMAMFIL